MSQNSTRTIGFTGTRQGLTASQILTLARLLGEHRPSTVHHGNAIGADEQFDHLVGSGMMQPPPYRVSHPCHYAAQQSKRTSPDEVFPAKAPLERNHDIVEACELLIACVAGPEEIRSGTWATIRYARKVGKPIVIIWPEGSTTTEGVNP